MEKAGTSGLVTAMRDGWGREINYLRISITDRCNLRCRYCMPPEGVPPIAHQELLRYEEILAIAAAAVSLGITRFKITGGEPLVRRGCAGLIRQLKSIPGAEQVTLTTNGLLLPQHLEELLAAGLDGVNISLDTLDDQQYRDITRCGLSASSVLETVRQCSRRLPTKLNAVLLPETADQLIPLARLAQRLPVDVRFIETMPIGEGAGASSQRGSPLDRLRQVWPDLAFTGERRGNGPADYYASAALRGRIGLIQAVSHCFCARCNRLRLTSTGQLKPCLYYAEGTDLRALLRKGCGADGLRQAISKTILQKPAEHRFGRSQPVPERRLMSQIGG